MIKNKFKDIYYSLNDLRLNELHFNSFENQRYFFIVLYL